MSSLHVYFSNARLIVMFAVAVMVVLFAGACGATGDRPADRGTGADDATGEIAPEGLQIFQLVTGIDFYEVRRTFDTGLSYDSMGFVHRPEWHLRFAAIDSVLIYSPEADKLLGYKMYHDHDQYFHFARESWQVIELHPDSITLQALTLKGLKVDRIKSNVYMKFYSENYIRTHIGESKIPLEDKIATLRQPTRQDSAFVLAQINRANRNPHDPDSTFASPDFARLESTHPALTIRKRKIEQSPLTAETPSYEYLYPEYYISIENAYQDFSHDFSVVVDEKGSMHLGEIFVPEEYVEAKPEVVQGIIDVYLHNWLEITPARTFGIPHASTVYLYVKGRKVDQQ